MNARCKVRPLGFRPLGFANELFNNAELALAAYADLNTTQSTLDQKLALIDAGMTDKQAKEFATRYPEVIAHIPNTDSGFSATVFKDTNGQLTVAFRGTEASLGNVDLTEADLSEIAPLGAAYHQIVDMFNWWQTISNPAGSMVNQFEIANYSSNPPAGAVLIADYTYLVPVAQVAATGELESGGDLSSLDTVDHSSWGIAA